MADLIPTVQEQSRPECVGGSLRDDFRRFFALSNAVGVCSAGTFIGVPITIAVLSISKYSPSARWLNELFGEASNDAKQFGG
jgi:hypothetical protein